MTITRAEASRLLKQALARNYKPAEPGAGTIDRAIGQRRQSPGMAAYRHHAQPTQEQGGWQQQNPNRRFIRHLRSG